MQYDMGLARRTVALFTLYLLNVVMTECFWTNLSAIKYCI